MQFNIWGSIQSLVDFMPRLHFGWVMSLSAVCRSVCEFSIWASAQPLGSPAPRFSSVFEHMHVSISELGSSSTNFFSSVFKFGFMYPALVPYVRRPCWDSAQFFSSALQSLRSCCPWVRVLKSAVGSFCPRLIDRELDVAAIFGGSVLGLGWAIPLFKPVVGGGWGKAEYAKMFFRHWQISDTMWHALGS